MDFEFIPPVCWSMSQVGTREWFSLATRHDAGMNMTTGSCFKRRTRGLTRVWSMLRGENQESIGRLLARGSHFA